MSTEKKAEKADILKVLDELRRLHATGVIDVIAVVALGPDRETNLIFMGTDIERPGDAVRLVGTLFTLQSWAATNELENLAPLPSPGPRGIVPVE